MEEEKEGKFLHLFPTRKTKPVFKIRLVLTLYSFITKNWRKTHTFQDRYTTYS